MGLANLTRRQAVSAANHAISDQTSEESHISILPKRSSSRLKLLRVKSNEAAARQRHNLYVYQ